MSNSGVQRPNIRKHLLYLNILGSTFPIRNFLIRSSGYSKTDNNRTQGANNEYTGGPGGPGTGFCGPGGG